MNLKQHLDYLFNPRSVAVIGASNAFGKWGFGIFRLISTKGGREVYPVNRHEPEVLGVKAYSSVTEIPGSVDCAVMIIPSREIPAAMDDCARKGIKAAVIISGGFAETGEEGARIQQETVEIASRGGIRFVGPNCMGHFNAHTDFYTTPFVPSVRKGPVALISQSGNSGASIVHSGWKVGLGFSKFVSAGNEADLHFEDYLEYLAADDETKVILGYVEGFREGRRFFELAREVTKKKPIVIMKAARTELGARAARSHTAALAGSDIVIDAAFKQCGVIRVEEIGEMIDAALALLGQPLPRGKRVGVVSMGGGLGVVVADALRRQGFELPLPSPVTMEKLNSKMSSRWSHGNPVDPAGDLVSYHSLWPLIEDENMDITMIIGGFGMVGLLDDLVGAVNMATDEVDKMLQAAQGEELKNLDTTIELMKKYQKPVVFTTMVSDAVRRGGVYDKLEQNYLTPCSTPEMAAKVLAHLVRYSEYMGILKGN
jgi:acyl-CoA synthetase (NDP forming)